jgi:hypothetical protein
MSEKHPHLGPWSLLPAKPGTCPECATDHPPELPHNQQSLTYQYHFYGKNGRWPTWADAMAHCTEEMRSRWTEELAKRGVGEAVASG